MTFDIHQVRRNREIIAANIRAADDYDSDYQTKIDVGGAHAAQPSQEESSSSPQNSGSTNDPRRSISPEGDSEPRNHRPVGSCSSDEAYSPIDDDRSDDQSRSSPDIDDLVNGSHAKYSNRNRSGSDSSESDNYASGGARRAPRFVMRGHIAALKDGFGFIETMAQDGEIFFHST